MEMSIKGAEGVWQLPDTDGGHVAVVGNRKKYEIFNSQEIFTKILFPEKIYKYEYGKKGNRENF